MSETPLGDLFRAAVDRWNAGERDVDETIVDPEVEIISTLVGPIEGTPVFRGYDGLRHWMANLDAAWVEWRLHVDETVERGSRLLALGGVHSRGRGSGVELDSPVAWVVDARDQRVLRMRILFDHDEGRREAGLD